MKALLQRLRSAVRARWLYHLGGPAASSMTLSMRRIYIVPTRAGLQCGGLLLLMLAGSLNYNLGLGYALTFLLGACVLADMVATARNLAGLTLTPGRAMPVFAGAAASFQIELAPAAGRQHYALWLGFQADGTTMVPCDLGADASNSPGGNGHTIGSSGAGAAGGASKLHAASIVLHAATSTRGWQTAGRIRLVTRFPLGLFRAWSYWQPAQKVLVYPAPEYPPMPLPTSASGSHRSHKLGGSDHFAGLRDYRPGDSPRHLAWRQIARHASEDHAALLARQFDGATAGALHFDLAQLPALLSLEQKLSRLCAWVLAAEACALPYSLQLGQQQITRSLGPNQQHACLRALALYQAHAAPAQPDATRADHAEPDQAPPAEPQP